MTSGFMGVPKIKVIALPLLGGITAYICVCVGSKLQIQGIASETIKENGRWVLNRVLYFCILALSCISDLNRDSTPTMEEMDLLE